MNPPIFISESKVLSILTWPLVNKAVEEALKSTGQNTRTKPSVPFSHQPARSLTKVENDGILFAMPGYIANYALNNRKVNTLGCKLVTCFKGNESNNSLPNILANILLFDTETGKLKCVMEATEITGWRTASASIVATKYLYFERSAERKPIVAVIGCGVQGRNHSFGFLSTFNISELRLWNRTATKTEKLLRDLENSKDSFLNKTVKLKIKDSVKDCCEGADIVITATFAPTPLIELEMLKTGAHICAVGAGPGNHHSEISEEVYLNSLIFVDTLVGAKSELNTLKANIVGEVGEIILNENKIPGKEALTIFQSMGMAVEDATVAQAVYEKFKN